MQGTAPELQAAARGKRGSSASDGLAALRGEIAAQPERWAWRVNASAQRAMSPALQDWLSKLAAASAAAPSGAALLHKAPTGASAASVTLHLDHDGEPRWALSLFVQHWSLNAPNAAGTAAATARTGPLDQQSSATLTATLRELAR